MIFQPSELIPSTSNPISRRPSTSSNGSSQEGDLYAEDEGEIVGEELSEEAKLRRRCAALEAEVELEKSQK